MNEYTNHAAQGAPCSYTTLGQYYRKGTMVDGVQPSTVTGKMLVPAYSAPGYNALTHDGSPSCAGYFTIGGAYGSGADNCNQQYVQTLCNGGGVGKGTGFKCDQKSGRCMGGSHLGTQGTFSNAFECQKNCHASGSGKGTGFKCDQKSGRCMGGAHMGSQGTFKNAFTCQQSCHATGFGS
jgi:hypothetical protein